MKKSISHIALYILFTLNSIYIWGNINYIQFDKISCEESLLEKYNFIVEHQSYVNHWSPQWNFDINKDDLINELKDSFDSFTKLDNNNLEVNLLLGDISHYLYNLHEDDYYQLAEKHYKKAINLAPDDYRPSWFLANHYALSNLQEYAIKYFLQSQDLLPEQEPAAFWEEYMFATATANMPSHCIFAMDKAKSILGEKSYFESQLGQTIYDRFEPVKKDSSYHYQDLWSASGGKIISFTSRPLGIKLLVDSLWQVTLYDYRNHQTGIVMVPPAITSKEGRDITYTIAVLMKTAKKEEKLEDYISNFTNPYPNKSNFTELAGYNEMISLEIKDENMYKDMGGAHMHMIGIKRECPRYPGLLLENPVNIKSKEQNKLTFYRAVESKDRFEGDIFYVVMLDACEDIYEEAYKLFKETFEKQLFIE